MSPLHASTILMFAALCLLPARARGADPAPGTCLGGDCTVGAPVGQLEPEKPQRRGFAQGAAWFGLLSAGLSVGGAVAIAVLDDLPSERISRGVWLGYNLVSLPIVALGSHLTRKHTKVPGYRGIRVLGWTAYGGALSNGVVQWTAAFRDYRQPWGLTIGAASLSALGLLSHAFDAYVCGRQARLKSLAGFTPTADGFVLRF